MVRLCTRQLLETITAASVRTVMSILNTALNQPQSPRTSKGGRVILLHERFHRCEPWRRGESGEGVGERRRGASHMDGGRVVDGAMRVRAALCTFTDHATKRLCSQSPDDASDAGRGVRDVVRWR
jgi:hypothetical protein